MICSLDWRSILFIDFLLISQNEALVTGFTPLRMSGAEGFVSPPLRVKVKASRYGWDHHDTVVLNATVLV